MREAGVKYVDEYRDKDLVHKLAGLVRNSVKQSYVFMEVCGGHTSAIRRFGIPSLLPPQIKLVSGPGCPVCVTGTGFIDQAVALSGDRGNIVVTFGDLIRVPGSFSSLEKAKSEGSDIRIVFSGLEALNIARENPGRKVIFLGIGFETTAPGTAVTVMEAKREGLSNFSLLSAHKVMPPVMEALITGGTKIDGFICPGHVATITGSSAFSFIPRQYGIACVITGFEPADILHAILMLVNQINNNLPKVEIQYTRAVLPEGNMIAKNNISKVFEYCDTEWRGFGIIPGSGLKLSDGYREFEAGDESSCAKSTEVTASACICGDILRGLRTPEECPLFATACTPENPEGACMVSVEGACNSYYRYAVNE
ncbi:MAG: hydrogenase formation protein HypD [Bacteroidales bacterium]